jgi:hypothetical protein
MLNYANNKFNNKTWVSLKGNFLPIFTGSSIYLDKHKQACMLGQSKMVIIILSGAFHNQFMSSCLISIKLS